MMFEKQKLQAIGKAICDAASEVTRPSTFYSEFLEYDEDDEGKPRDCQFIVNIHALDSSGDKTVLKDELAIEECESRVRAVADAICSAFNAVMPKSGSADGSWHVHSELNYWDENNDESDCHGPVSAVQCCIFQRYN